MAKVVEDGELQGLYTSHALLDLLGPGLPAGICLPPSPFFLNSNLQGQDLSEKCCLVCVLLLLTNSPPLVLLSLQPLLPLRFLSVLSGMRLEEELCEWRVADRTDGGDGDRGQRQYSLGLCMVLAKMRS